MPLGSELGEAKAFPPVLTVVYRLMKRGPITPLAGAGASILFGYGAKVTNKMLTEVSQPTMTLSPAPGLVLQLGAEMRIWRNVEPVRPK